MKKFELLRDLPNAYAGEIFFQWSETEIWNVSRNITFDVSVANDKTWFRELTESVDKQRHLELLETAFWSNLAFNSATYYGYVGLEDKRPFGNSNVEDGICDIIGLVPNTDEFGLTDYTSEQLKYAGKLYREELIPYLKSKYALS